jgi:hypothetical protein
VLRGPIGGLSTGLMAHKPAFAIRTREAVGRGLERWNVPSEGFCSKDEREL